MGLLTLRILVHGFLWRLFFAGAAVQNIEGE